MGILIYNNDITNHTRNIDIDIYCIIFFILTFLIPLDETERDAQSKIHDLGCFRIYLIVAACKWMI